MFSPLALPGRSFDRVDGAEEVLGLEQLGVSIGARPEVVLLVVVGLHALADRVGSAEKVLGLARLGVLRRAIRKIEKN